MKDTCPTCPYYGVEKRENCYDFIYRNDICSYKEEVPHKIVDQLSLTVVEIYDAIINYEKQESFTETLKNLCEKYLDEYYTFEQLKKELK